MTKDVKSSLLKYIAKNEHIGKDMLPYATIASRLFVQYGMNPFGKKVTISSDVPMQKGYASSAVCSTAFTMVLLNSEDKKLDDATSIDIARDGERIVHKNEGAGRMDVGPAYFGGYAVVNLPEGIKRAEIATKINIVVFDTGPKPPTSVTVGAVRALHDKNPNETDKILREIDDCVLKCIDALQKNDMKALGKQMFRNHLLLKKLGVSSEGLDKAVSVAMSHGAYGAKLCGGGGGGMGIALVDSAIGAQKVIGALKANGFDAYEVKISLKGSSNNPNRRKIA